MSNHLINETSPYLLQHAHNPVNWYPWGEAAFNEAKRKDLPIFLSIGYSSCHWCHVMERESFSDSEIAELLNKNFICIKVDKEERPDIDSIYMSVCQAFTGSGGWPTSIFMTAEQKPFFAGTFFPKKSRGGMLGMSELLNIIADKWKSERKALISQAEQITSELKNKAHEVKDADDNIIQSAVSFYKTIYDRENGGFGNAPKFPAPHNLLFLLDYSALKNDHECLIMAELTLIQMYRGGMFDHIGYGFCRYSTDNLFLIPHFEKMLYDNALLILAYCKAYSVTKKAIYLDIAKKTASFILEDMTSKEGSFYSALDADIDGEEGKFYALTPKEIASVLGEKDAAFFCRHYGITEKGNFDGKSIPNLLNCNFTDHSFEKLLPKLRLYRKERCSLGIDDKVLTLWNSLMIAAMCALYHATKDVIYLTAAKKSNRFICENLSDGDTLFVSTRNGKKGVCGFLDDYGGYIFAQLALYRVTLEEKYLKKAESLCQKVLSDFAAKDSGFYMYGKNSEELILRPVDTYDGAIPSGNSLMAVNLVMLYSITKSDRLKKSAENQLKFLKKCAGDYSIGHAAFLTALLMYENPPISITVVKGENDCDENLIFSAPFEAAIKILNAPLKEYPLKNSRTTYYVCKNNSCLPPFDSLQGLI